ncbi:hypothetical protein OH492_10555 [Vibrio chagasii]|nr:hypothetical protein [Vibrio chagasii]
MIFLIPLSYTLSVDGKGCHVNVGGETIFTLTLAASASGDDVLADVTLVLNKTAFNHDFVRDSLTLSLNVKGTDFDDTALIDGNFKWVVKDGGILA